MRRGKLDWELLFLISWRSPYSGSNRIPKVARWSEDPIRVGLLKRFPYAIYFQLSDSELVVLGVLHLNRDEPAWRDRTT